MVEPTRLNRPLPPDQKHFATFGQAYRRWTATLDEGLTVDDCLVETFWKHVASAVQGPSETNPLGRGDIIEVRTYDNGDYAELMITAVSKGGLRVKILREIKDTAVVTVPDSAPFDIKWIVGNRTFSVVRRADKQPVSQGHQTKVAALAWITDTMKQAAA